jgi:hypothetical protein
MLRGQFILSIRSCSASIHDSSESALASPWSKRSTIEAFITPVESILTVAGVLNLLGRIILFGGMLLLQVAFMLNLQPMLRRARRKKKALYNQPRGWGHHCIDYHIHVGWFNRGRNLLSTRHTLRLIVECLVPYKLNCLEQRSRQLCFNKRYEKTYARMSHPHHCLSTRDSYACSASRRQFTLPNRNGSPYANTCY